MVQFKNIYRIISRNLFLLIPDKCIGIFNIKRIPVHQWKFRNFPGEMGIIIAIIYKIKIIALARVVPEADIIDPELIPAAVLEEH